MPFLVITAPGGGGGKLNTILEFSLTQLRKETIVNIGQDCRFLRMRHSWHYRLDVFKTSQAMYVQGNTVERLHCVHLLGSPNSLKSFTRRELLMAILRRWNQLTAIMSSREVFDIFV